MTFSDATALDSTATFSAIAGDYVLQVTADDTEFQDTDTVTITVNPPLNQDPTASFTATPSSGTVPVSVTFDATASTDPDGTIVDYAWDFGDGTTGTGVIVAHTYTATGTNAVQLTVTDNAGGTGNGGGNVPVTPNPTSWWDESWEYRLPLTINGNGIDRSNHPAEVAVNFTDVLTTLGESGALDPATIRVIEVNAQGDAIDVDVPFQFDPDAGFDPSTNAAGTVVLLLTGPTTGDRFYQVFFDLIGSSVPTPPTVPTQITLTDDVLDEGQLSYQIDTPTATYLYHKQGAGFSSLLDTEGNDWIDYHPTGGSAGNFRGIPNLVFPEGQFHPGDATATSTILSQGPLKLTIHSITNDSLWEGIWEIYPEFAKFTLLNTNHDYWFLYEGTPGGTLEPATDIVVRSDGTSTLLSGTWEGDLTGEEWVYLGDPTVGRSLFIAHHEEDTVVDSYRTLRWGDDAHGVRSRFNEHDASAEPRAGAVHDRVDG